ncbi:MliC family protein [Burkholderia oklahomensis]|uniref:MliC family protein n=1 Tax=Burkholderia oklahomensis TaxID=342113 RepID=UPI00265330B6|nr:MliC family protein [Burkholderia oklahomensis]MDN7672656.1 MliC family protein [Burkholderia oklahomensis]
MNGKTLAALGAAGLCVAAGAAHAARLTVEEIDADARETVVYRCANEPKPVRVSYWRADNGQSFALVPVNGSRLLFVDTVSASGVRYQAGRYVWWTKGRDANLYDEIAGEKAPPVLGDCSEIRTKRKKG